MLQFTDPITAGVTLVRPAIQSANYVPGVSGWAVFANGNQEFNGGTFRGGIVEDAPAFIYSSVPAAAGNLTESLGVPPGTATDGHGNAVLPGDTTYAYTIGHTAVIALQKTGGTITAYTAPTQAGPYAQVSTVVFDTGGNIAVPGTLKLAGAMVVVPPSNDVTGATDGAAITSWLASGYEVHLAPAVYYTNTPIQLPNSAILRGAGRPAINQPGAMTAIKATVAMPAIICGAGWLANTQATAAVGVNVSDVQLWGNGLASTGIVLQTYDSVIRNVAIENVLFQGILFTVVSRNGAVIMTGSAVNNRVEGCSIHMTGDAGIKTLESGTTAFTDGFITDTIISSPAGSAIIVQQAAGWKIAGNHLYGLAQHGMQVGPMENTRILGNYIESWGQGATAGTWYAIDGANLGQSGLGNVIADNSVWLGTAPGNAGSTVDGIALTAKAASTLRCMVKGNSIYCVPAAGFAAANGIVYTNAAATSVTEVVSDNDVNGNWTAKVVQAPNGGTMGVTATGV